MCDCLTCITTSNKPTKKTLHFIKDFMNIIPKSVFLDRKRIVKNRMFLYFKKKGIKNVIIFTEKKGILNELLLFNLDIKITFCFKIESAMLKRNLVVKSQKTSHDPELMFFNFKDELGLILGFGLHSLFNNRPSFQGRQLLVFYLSKNILFVRYFRYIFSFSGNDVRLQELGPRLSLRFIRIIDKKVQ